MRPAGLEPENNYAGGDQQQFYTTDPFSRQKKCYIMTISASVQLENKYSVLVSQGACRQEEMIGGKPPVIK
jgi:hypothetical protein